MPTIITFNANHAELLFWCSKWNDIRIHAIFLLLCSFLQSQLYSVFFFIFTPLFVPSLLHIEVFGVLLNVTCPPPRLVETMSRRPRPRSRQSLQLRLWPRPLTRGCSAGWWWGSIRPWTRPRGRAPPSSASLTLPALRSLRWLGWLLTTHYVMSISLVVCVFLYYFMACPGSGCSVQLHDVWREVRTVMFYAGPGKPIYHLLNHSSEVTEMMTEGSGQQQRMDGVFYWLT